MLDGPHFTHGYAFSHLLTQEAAYRALLGSNRRALHGAAADALTLRVVAGAPDEAALLIRLYGHLEAAARWSEAHDRCCQLLRLLVGDGRLEEWAHWAGQAQAAWEQARSGNPGLAEQSAQLAGVAAHYLAATGHVDEARTRAHEALELAQAEGSPRQIAAALLYCGMARHYAGNHDPALEYYQQGLEAFRACGDVHGEALALNTLGVALQEMGRFAESRAAHVAALELARASNNLLLQANLALNLGAGCQERHQLAEAQDWYRIALDTSRAVGSRTIEGLVVGNLGDMAALDGQLEEAKRRYEQALATSREVRSPRTMAWWTGKIAAHEMRTGNLERARVLITEALAEVRRAGDKVMLVEGLMLAGDIERAAGRWAEAEQQLDAAEATAAEAGPSAQANFAAMIAEHRANLAASRAAAG